MVRVEGVEVAPGEFAPLLRISTEIDGNELPDSFAIVDSGADETILPAELLPPTVNYESLPVADREGEGAGGPFEIRDCEGSIRWRRWKIASTFQIAEPEKLLIPLLGRQDFFARFRVTFDWTSSRPSMVLDPVRRRRP